MRTTTAAPAPRSLRRGDEPGRLARRRWLAAWLGGPVIGIANGVTRELTYGERVGELTAHQISTGTAIVLFAGYFALLQRRWPLPSRRVALQVGSAWLVATVAFEFAFGHWGDGKSWSELAGDYDVTAGHLWPLVLAWLALGPETARRVLER